MSHTRLLALLAMLQSAAAFTAQSFGSCPVSRSVAPPLMWIKVVPEEDKDRTVRISTSATAPAKDANAYALMLEQMVVDQGEAEEDGEEAAFDPDFDEDVLAMMYHRDAPASKDEEAALALAIDEAATAQLEAEAALESRAAAEAKVAAAERVAAEAAIELARAKAEAAMEIGRAEEAVQRARLAMERAGVSHGETEALTAMAEASVLAEAEGAAQAEAEAEAQVQAQMEAQMQAQLEAQMQAQMQAEADWEAEQAPEEDHNAGVSIGGDDASFWASASKPAPKPKPSPAPRPRPPPPSTPPKAPPVTSISTGGTVRMKINGKQVTTQGPVRIGANEGRRGDGDTEGSQFWAPATSKKVPDTTPRPPRPPSTATTESSSLTAAFAKAVGAKGVGSAASTAKPTAAATTPKSKPKPKPSTPPPPSETSKSIPSQVEHTAWWDSHKPSNTRFGQ